VRGNQEEEFNLVDECVGKNRRVCVCERERECAGESMCVRERERVCVPV
jgi:hypothetical protein